MKLIVIACAVLLFACDAAKDTVPDASDGGIAGDVGGPASDAGEAGDGGVKEGDIGWCPCDGGDAGVDVGDAAAALDTGHDGIDGGACASVISGDAPFGVRLQGTAEFISKYGTAESYGEGTVAFDLYFPQGYKAGAPFVAAQETHCPRRLAVYEGVLDTEGRAHISLRAHVSYQEFTLEGDLMANGDGVDADVDMNLADPGTDIGMTGTARMRLCPAGEPAPPELAPTTFQAAPQEPIELFPRAPMRQEDLVITAQAGDQCLPLAITLANGQVTARPPSIFPPGMQMTFSAEGSRDLIGRPVTLGTIYRCATDGVLEDLSFATPPASDAATCFGNVADGSLNFSSNWTYTDSVMLASLGERDGTEAVLSFTMTCTHSCWADLKIPFSLLDGTGVISTVNASPSQTPQTLTLPAAGRRAYWLTVVRDHPQPCPQYGSQQFADIQLKIDEIIFR